jgi:hypothetical protein
MVMSLAGLRPEKDCAGNAQQQLKLQTRPLVKKGAPHQQTRNYPKIIKESKNKNWLWVQDTVPLTVSCNNFDCWQ